MTPADTGSRWSRIRRFPRYRTDLRVIVAAVDNPQPVYGRAAVIAEGGFGATLAGELAVGQPVAAEVVLAGAGQHPFRANAVVRYRHGFQHGFQFLDVTPQQRATLRDFCSALLPAD